MNDAYSKVIGIFIGICLLFGLPFMYLMERQKTLEQMYLLTESSYFVDSVRNTGVMTRNMYLKFSEQVSKAGLYKIKFTQVSRKLTEIDGEVRFMDIRYFTSDILQNLEDNGEYQFSQNDYFKIEIETADTKQVVIYYGGTIKYEPYEIWD